MIPILPAIAKFWPVLVRFGPTILKWGLPIAILLASHTAVYFRGKTEVQREWDAWSAGQTIELQRHKIDDAIAGAEAYANFVERTDGFIDSGRAGTDIERLCEQPGGSEGLPSDPVAAAGAGGSAGNDRLRKIGSEIPAAVRNAERIRSIRALACSRGMTSEEACKRWGLGQ